MMVECSLLAITVLELQVGLQYIPGHVGIVHQVGEQMLLKHNLFFCSQRFFSCFGSRYSTENVIFWDINHSLAKQYLAK